jgi:hypothetical protein
MDRLVSGSTWLEQYPIINTNFDESMQHIVNLASKGAGYWFNGINQKIIGGDATKGILNGTNLSFEFIGAITSTSAGFHFPPIVGNNRGVEGYYVGTIGLAYRGSAGTIGLVNEKDGTTIVSGANFPYTLGENVHVIATLDISTLESKIYKNAKLIDTVTMTGAIVNDTTHPLSLMSVDGTRILGGKLNLGRLFNTVLTATQAADLCSGQELPFKWISDGINDNTGDSFTSGTIIIGREYIISVNTSGGIFTNVGAADNNVGTKFVATEITPTSWGADGELTRLGCVANYSNKGFGHYSCIDNSGNGLHGTNNGAIPTNLKIGDRRTAYLLTTSTSPTMTDVIPAGWKVNSISMETAQNLTNIDALQETSNDRLLDGKTLNNGSMVWNSVADHNIYSTDKDIVLTLTGNGEAGTKVYVELEKIK